MGADKYDFIITYSSTDYEYMLRQQGQTKDFNISDAPLTPQTLVTESASPTNLQPEREIQISQVDWRKGFQDFKLDDQYKYYDSENCDARFKNEVTLAPKKLSAISFGSEPATATVTDGGLEVWDNESTLTNWTSTGDGVTMSVTQAHEGTYSARVSENDAGTIYQDIDWDVKYRGTSFTFTAWFFSGSSGTEGWVGIDDGVDETEGTDAITETITWQQGTVSKRLSQSATRLRLVIHYDADVSYVHLDDAAVTYDDWEYGAVTDIVEFGDDIVVSMGNCLFNIASGSAVQIGTLPQTITDLCVFENYLYIAQGWSDEYYYTADLSTFTECTLSNSTAKYMANIGGSVFLISDTNSTLRSSDNPINGGTAFSTPYQVDSDDWDITGLVDHEDTWFVRKQDSVYYLSGSDVLELIPEISSEASTTYTYGLYYWKGNLYIGSGTNSLYEYDVSSGTITTLSPTKYAVGDSDYDEELLAVCGDETYLYAAFDNGSDIKILSGRWENVEGSTDFYWHPLYTLSSHNDITSMLISSLSGSKRLYVGTDTYTDGIIPYFIPVGYSQPYTETGYECQSSGTFYAPWYVSNFPTETKYWKSVDFTSICCTDKTSITPYYQIKGGSWTAMTALTTSAYSGGYPSETTDSRDIGQSSERIRFKFAMAASVDEYTPILYGKGGAGIVTYAVLQPTRKQQITATIQLAPEIRLRDNMVEERTVSTDLSNLRTIYDAGGEITITAPDETTYTCVFARDGYTEQLAYDETMRTEVWWVTLKLLET